jgi:hypothetical protein
MPNQQELRRSYNTDDELGVAKVVLSSVHEKAAYLTRRLVALCHLPTPGTYFYKKSVAAVRDLRAIFLPILAFLAFPYALLKR